MKKGKKMLAIVLAFIFSGTMVVNAETKYTDSYKYNFSESFKSSIQVDGAIEKDNKYYLFDDDKYHGKLQEISFGEKISLKGTNLKYDSVNDWFNANNKYIMLNDAFISYNDTTSKYDVESVELPAGLNGVGTNILTSIELKHSLENNYAFYYGDKIVVGFDLNKYDIYNSKGEYIRTLDFDDIISKIPEKELSRNLSNYVMFTYKECSANKILFQAYFYGKNDNIAEALVFNDEGKLLLDVVDQNITSGPTYPLEVYSKNNVYYGLYYNQKQSNIILIDSNGNKKVILSDCGSYIMPNAIFYDGLIVINDGKDKENGYLYDSDLNLIYKQENGGIRVERIINSLEDLENAEYLLYGGEDSMEYVHMQITSKSNIITKGNYLLTILNGDSGSTDDTEYKIMSIEDTKKVNISGFIKDSDGNILKDYIIELHSTPRTYIIDENGYFTFENVEEGHHTLTLKKSDGTVVAVKEFDVILGTETKFDGDTLYFNSSDAGVNLSIKIDGDKLVIDSSVDKEQTKNIENVEKLDNVDVPKTFDNILKYIIIFLTLAGTGIYLIKKNKKIKCLKSIK